VANERDLVSGVEAASILGVDPSTVSRWSDERLQPAARKLNHVTRLGKQGAKLFRRADVERLRDELAEAAS
jgi:DNA-binding transcriptional MerR regulator